MLTKETVPLTGDGRWNSFCSPAAPCMSINAFVFRFCLHTPLLAQNPCNPSGSLLDLPRPIGNATAHAHAHAHWHPCSCQSMCRVTVSLHLSVTCMSVCLFYVTPGERISNSSRLPTCELAGCQLGFLLSCLLSCFPAYLLAILAGRGQESEEPQWRMFCKRWMDFWIRNLHLDYKSDFDACMFVPFSVQRGRVREGGTALASALLKIN